LRGGEEVIEVGDWFAEFVLNVADEEDGVSWGVVVSDRFVVNECKVGR